jgi:PIN domain nuclease of toxin-antitoxin system
MSVVVDTQALLWYVLDSSRLSPAAAATLDRTAEEGARILVPTISLVEVEYLRDKRVIGDNWYDKLWASLGDPAFAWKALSLDLNVVASIPRISRAIVPDMPDRIIAATALALGLPLVSSDKKIRQVEELNVIW